MRFADRGLDNTLAHDRIYWGGNLYWLLADVRIRVKPKTTTASTTRCARSSKAAVTGRPIGVWNVFWKTGDRSDENQCHEGAPPASSARSRAPLIWTNFWKNLGIDYKDGAVTFDNSAPLGLQSEYPSPPSIPDRTARWAIPPEVKPPPISWQARGFSRRGTPRH